MVNHEWVADNIKGLAGLRHVSMQSVYEAGNLSKQQYHQRSRGDTEWRASELVGIARHLQVTVDNLLSDPSDLVGTISSWLSVSADQPIFEAA